MDTAIVEKGKEGEREGRDSEGVGEHVCVVYVCVCVCGWFSMRGVDHSGGETEREREREREKGKKRRKR